MKIELKNIIIIFTVIIMFMISAEISFAEDLEDTQMKVFSDVKEEQWFYEKLQLACKRSIIAGFEDGTFRPNETLTREQYIKMLIMVIDTTFVARRDSIGTWFTPYYNNAINLRIITDTTKDQNYYKEPIKREEVVLYTYRAFNVGKSKEVIQEDKNIRIRDASVELLDYFDMSNEVQQAIRVLYDKNIVNGYTDGTFKKEGILTRAESTSLVYSLIQMRMYDIANDRVIMY